MFMEYERRIAQLRNELESHPEDEKLKGALEEAEKLFAFYKNQIKEREVHHVDRD